MSLAEEDIMTLGAKPKDAVLRKMLSTPPKPHELPPESTVDAYSPEETDARREAALARMLATPHKPHKASKGKRKESSQSK